MSLGGRFTQDGAGAAVQQRGSNLINSRSRGERLTDESHVLCLGGLVAAAAITLSVTTSLLRDGISLSKAMPEGPTWDFNRSWASNVALAAGVASLAGLLTLLPQSSAQNKATLTLLSVTMAALSGLAPAVYVFLRSGPDYSHGSIATFLVSGCLSLWAAFGQLGLQIVILERLRIIVAAEIVTRTCQVIIGLVVVLLGRYGLTTMLATARQVSTARADGAKGWTLL